MSDVVIKLLGPNLKKAVLVGFSVNKAVVNKKDHHSAVHSPQYRTDDQ